MKLQEATTSSRDSKKEIESDVEDEKTEAYKSFDIDSKEGRNAFCKLKGAVPKEIVEENPTLIHFICEASLRFRRGHVPSATIRVLNYLRWRKKFIGGFQDQTLRGDPDVERILRSKMLRLVENVDKVGRAALVVKLANHTPDKTSALQVLRTWHYVIMKALKSPKVQEHGIIFLGDFDQATFSNLDIRIPKAILNALSKNMPLRLYRAFILRPFFVMRMIFPVIWPFLSKKMKRRLQICPHPAENMTKMVNTDKLPLDVYGSGKGHPYLKMIERWMCEEFDLNPIEKPKVSQPENETLPDSLDSEAQPEKTPVKDPQESEGKL
ncbi:hypothetical protein AAMO2058_001602800 [Amorphochlora amoebiformis]